MVRRAFGVVAVVLACVAAMLLTAAAALDEGSLESGMLSRLPACPARLSGGACALCGMSHSLVAMADGDWREARRYNAAGPWLFGALVFQTALGVAIASTRRRVSRI